MFPRNEDKVTLKVVIPINVRKRTAVINRIHPHNPFDSLNNVLSNKSIENHSIGILPKQTYSTNRCAHFFITFNSFIRKDTGMILMSLLPIPGMITV